MGSKGWKRYKLKEFAKLVKDQYLPSSDNHLVYIGLEHIEQQTLRLNGTGNSSDVISQKFRFKSGDILFGKLRPYFRKVYRPQFNGVCSTDIWVVRAKEGFDQGFLFYFLASQEFVNESIIGSSGTRMPRADWSHLAETEWYLPPLPTQRRIADILSALDEKIELNRQTNATLEAIAQSIFREWFVEFNYPDLNEKDPKGLLRNHTSLQASESDKKGSKQAGQTFRVSDMVESELGPIPKGWRVTPLDEIADFLNGLALQKYTPENDNEFLPVIKIREMKNGITNSTDKASRNIPDKYIVRDGDLLFSWSGSLEVKFWIGGEGALNQHLFKVTSKKYPLWFCYFWLSHHLEDFRRIAEDKTTTMGHIQRHHLTNALCLVPENLEPMDKAIRPIVESIINNEQQSATLASLRDALLPKLMSGEIEV